jgi:hypothetical protein
VGGSVLSVLIRRLRLCLALGMAGAAVGITAASVATGTIANATYSNAYASTSLLSVNINPIGPLSGNLLTVGGTEADPGNGSGHGHVTLLAVLGHEVYGVDSSGSTGDPLAPLENAALANSHCFSSVCVALLDMSAGPAYGILDIASASVNDLQGWYLFANAGSGSSALDNPGATGDGCKGGYAGTDVAEVDVYSPSESAASGFLGILGSSASQAACAAGSFTSGSGWVLQSEGFNVPTQNGDCLASLPSAGGLGVSTCTNSTSTSGGTTTTSSNAVLILLPIGNASVASSSASGPSS